MELQQIQSKIHEIRGIRVMLDFDLAQLYQVETRALKQSVRRNMERFPPDFMFELTNEEYNSLKINIRSQFVTLKPDGRGKYSKYAPFAFTEQGVSMLSAVLRSSIAVQTSITIMRAFVAMRDYLFTSSASASELSELRAKLALLEKSGEETLEAVNDLSEDTRQEFAIVYQAIAELSAKPQPQEPRNPIGYKK